MERLVVSIALFAGRVLLAMLLGIGAYLGTLVAFADLPIDPWDAKRLFPFVILLAIVFACVVAVLTLRWTGLRRESADPRQSELAEED